ncbi:MAG: TatD DNase family protein [Methanothermococcus sp.]|uniref:YchF/TatD family DNA exonuclease n=1 Tax=Methanothermococcus TaxID=155862 RepID=UPI000367B81E|nr:MULTISPECIES: YchF/TatD family DNA exonuclease [Methanothermococcus]MDK2790957.1 TatD DNase family protein [Methanothermococcus sp.]MDK2978349.1 TatD DNase family protein [Bacteroidales bacterium]MDK2987932.1 TatD DNase family protein [Methanothermococcus sp.]
MEFKYIDAHCHIEDKSFNKNRDEIVKNAKDNGVEIVTSGASLGGCKRALNFKKEYGIYLTLGFHPGRTKAQDNVVDKVYNLIRENEKELLAVGEVGLDINVQNLDRQKIVFEKFVGLAEELNKPVIIHGRGLEKECFDVLNNRVVSMFHCYSGSINLAKELIENGHYVSLSTLVCFSKDHQNLVENLDLENIVVETDSPYLSPIKGEKNEPKNVIKVVEKIWEIKKEEYSLAEITKIIYDNTKKLYRI